MAYQETRRRHGDVLPADRCTLLLPNATRGKPAKVSSTFRLPKRRCKTMAITVKHQKMSGASKRVNEYDESTNKSNGGTPSFFGGFLARIWETQAGRKPLEADWNHWPETCMLFGATCKCRVELLLLKKKQWTWEVSNWEGVGWDCCRWKHTNVKKSRTSRNRTKSNHKIYECFAARHLACIIHLWQHGLQWSFFRTMCGCTKTPHRTTAKPTAGANHWVMEDQSRSTIHALGIDHGWQVDSDRCISIFHGNFPSPLQLQSSAFTSVDFPTQKLANQRCPLYTECYLISWSTRLRYLLFLVILDTPDTSLIILPSTLQLISVVSARGALGGYDDDASCAPPMVKTEGLMHQRHRPGLRSDLPSKTNELRYEMTCPSHGNLLREKKEAIFTSKYGSMVFIITPFECLNLSRSIRVYQHVIHGFHPSLCWTSLISPSP